MKFGIGYYSLQSPPHNPRDHKDLYSEMLEEITAAEDYGFESAWLTEHHLLDDGYCPSLLVTAAAIAARTKRLRIGTGIYLMPLHDPIRTAEDAAVVDLISKGRLILGLGLGYRQEEFDVFGRSLKERKGRMEESIEILNKSWSEGEFSFKGKYYQYDNINVTPKPVQKPIPIWIGAFSEPAIKRAARMNAPLFIAAIGVIPIIKYLIDMHRGFLSEFGYDPDKLEQPVVREVYVSRDGRSKIWEKIKENITYTAKGYASWGSFVDREGNLISDPTDPSIDDIALDQAIIGSPEECIETINQYKEAVPMDPLICRFKLPGLSHRDAMESMKLFSNEVMPYVK
ncbi:MAG: LLM class flavin-dependent oxidoreductase [Candidatus Dadabacteria bacterium]|jgi:alkanesulfonate monooxygenase SsuD/methylene tetrahydromethanopterin reductase-like flavin-dependent oxidoreductase (luciferase family)